MISQKKLSILMLVSVVCIGFAGSAHGMNWTGKEKIRYMLDKNKAIIGCRSDGVPLPDKLENLVGKKIMDIAPISGLSESQKELLQSTFLSARMCRKAALATFTLFGGAIEQTFKISAYDCAQGEAAFVLRMSLLVHQWYGTSVLGDSLPEALFSMNAGLDELGRQSTAAGQKQNNKSLEMIGEQIGQEFLLSGNHDHDSDSE